MNRHLLGARFLQSSEIKELLNVAADFKDRLNSNKPLPDMSKHSIGLLFFADSTRTRVSFEQAAYYLGFRVINFSSARSPEDGTGEGLKDTILTLSHERLDALVMRHTSSGAPIFASKHFSGPVINAGDGRHEHPTQALADALTIRERKGKIEGLTVAIVGDVNGSRVARSNAWLLSKMGANVRLVGPRTLMPAHVGKLPGEIYYDLEHGIDQADVIICLRLLKSRMRDGMLCSIREYSKFYQINHINIKYAAKNCLVMHPGPVHRGIELDDSVTDSGASGITQQVENSIYARMAALHWVFQNRQSKKPSTKELEFN